MMTDTENRALDIETEAAAPRGEEPAAETEMATEAPAEPEATTEPAGPTPEQAVVQLAEEIERLTQENGELKDRALRALAETENTRRRAQKDKEDTAKFAVSSFARDMLTVADNLGRAVAALPEGKAEDPVFVNMRDGIAAVERELATAFERHGIVRLDPMGEKFDPNYHQAMFEVPDSGQVPGTVVQIMQAGYVLHGRLLRPAMVGVAKGEPPQKVDTEA